MIQITQNSFEGNGHKRRRCSMFKEISGWYDRALSPWWGLGLPLPKRWSRSTCSPGACARAVVPWWRGWPEESTRRLTEVPWSPCGMTIGVLGSGLDRVYPPENAPLYAETVKRGLLVSQFPFGSAPSPDNLRQRNKLIAALADALVVAESGIPGGALIAARATLEQGKNLFALPWQTDAPSRTGNRRLLEARLARAADADDVESLFDRSLFCGPGTGLEKAWNAAFPPSTAMKGLAPSPDARAKENIKSTQTKLSSKQPSRPKRSEDEAATSSGAKEARLRSLREGDRVTHPTHGRGRIVEVRDGAEGRRIIVAFRKDGLRLTLPLETAETQLIRG